MKQVWFSNKLVNTAFTLFHLLKSNFISNRVQEGSAAMNMANRYCRTGMLKSDPPFEFSSTYSGVHLIPRKFQQLNHPSVVCFSLSIAELLILKYYWSFMLWVCEVGARARKCFTIQCRLTFRSCKCLTMIAFIADCHWQELFKSFECLSEDKVLLLKIFLG